MSRRKRYIENLTAEQKQYLLEGYKNGRSHDFRLRCHCILLSAQGKSVPELKALFEISHLTVYNWFNRWELEGIEGLKVRSGRGRKRKLDIENEEHVKAVQRSLKRENRNLNQLKLDLESSLDFEISKVTIRRFLKKLDANTNDFQPV